MPWWVQDTRYSHHDGYEAAALDGHPLGDVADHLLALSTASARWKPQQGASLSTITHVHPWPCSMLFHSGFLTQESDMPWHKVVIRHHETARWSAARLMRPFIMGYHEAGATPPANAVVYHSVNETGDHVYYFSPEASTIAIDTKAFHHFDVSQCADKPHLDGFEQVTIS